MSDPEETISTQLLKLAADLKIGRKLLMQLQRAEEKVWNDLNKIRACPSKWLMPLLNRNLELHSWGDKNCIWVNRSSLCRDGNVDLGQYKRDPSR